MAGKQTHEAVDEINDLQLEQEDFDLDDESGDEELDEATASAMTLRPGKGSNGTESKAHTLATFTQLLSQLGHEDLSHLHDQAMALFGPNKTPGATDMSAKNRASVSMKPSAAVGKSAWKEDIDAMFAGDELNEEMTERLETVFEAALNTRLTIEEARLQEEYEAKQAELEEQYEQALAEELEAIQEDITTKLDQYADYVIEQWMEENAIAIENSLRAEIAENFINALRNTFAEHFIEVPAERLDLMAEMRAEIEEVKAQLNETLDRNIELTAVIEEAHIEATIEEVSEGLAETQRDKLRTLAEGIEFTDPDAYRRKLEIVKEQYFKTAPKAASTGLITESIDGEDNSETGTTGYIAPGMDRYIKAVAKSSK